MTKTEIIDRWAEYIIPAVFKAESALQNTHPEWHEKLKSVTNENVEKVAKEYCTAIATIIVEGAERDENIQISTKG